MKLKNILLQGLSLVLVAALAIGGTLAYLTDRESETNVFTVGDVQIDLDEDFEQGATLIPGVYIDKKPTITNTGKNDAWVWATIAVPADLNQTVGGCEVLSMSYDSDSFEAWDIFFAMDNVGQIEKDGVQYNVYPLLYLEPLTKGETTANVLDTVSLCEHVDIDPEGNMYHVVGGEATELGWNINEDGNPVIYVNAYAIQTEGFATVQNAYAAYQDQWGENGTEWGEIPTVVYTADQLQTALDKAVNGDIITLGADIEGNVTITQKNGVKITLDGNGKTIDGSITVDGKSKRYETAGVTIENVKFSADALSTDAFVNLGKSGDTNTRYTNNVTVSNCTFDYTGTDDKVAIKSYTGGDWNLTVDGCTAAAGMHSLVQVTNVEKGLTITNCNVNSKNGINLNSTPYLNMSGCEFDTTGYCVRIGVNGSTNNGTFTIANSTLKSANGDDDAVIILRGTMTGATLNLDNVTLNGTPDITGEANVVEK